MTEDTSNRKPTEPRIPDEVKDHFRAARKEMRAGLRAIFPPEVTVHGRKARREMLLAWRSVIDVALEHLEDDPDTD